MNIIEFFKTTEPIILVGYTFLLLGELLTIFNFRAIMHARSAVNWNKAREGILDSKLVMHRSSNSGRSCKPKLEYQFIVRDKKFKAKRVYFGSNIMSSFKKKRSQTIVDKYPKDREVAVYYNPIKENMSVLETGVK